MASLNDDLEEIRGEIGKPCYILGGRCTFFVWGVWRS